MSKSVPIPFSEPPWVSDLFSQLPESLLELPLTITSAHGLTICILQRLPPKMAKNMPRSRRRAPNGRRRRMGTSRRRSWYPPLPRPNLNQLLTQHNRIPLPKIRRRQLPNPQSLSPVANKMAPQTRHHPPSRGPKSRRLRLPPHPNLR